MFYGKSVVLVLFFIVLWWFWSWRRGCGSAATYGTAAGGRGGRGMKGEAEGEGRKGRGVAAVPQLTEPRREGRRAGLLVRICLRGGEDILAGV